MEQSFELYKAQQLAKLDGSEDYLHSPVDDMETHTINHSEDDTEPEILSLGVWLWIVGLIFANLNHQCNLAA